MPTELIEGSRLTFPNKYFLPIPEIQLWDWDWRLLWSGHWLGSESAEQLMAERNIEVAYLTTYTPGSTRHTYILVRDSGGVRRIELDNEALDTMVEYLAYALGIPRAIDVVHEVLSILSLSADEYWTDTPDPDQGTIPGLGDGYDST